MKETYLAIALLLIVTACATPEDTFQIGVVTALTGKAAEYGTNVQRGVTLAIEEINRDGGIKGKRLVAIVEDERCDAKRGFAATKKLVEADQVIAIVGPMCSGVAMSAAPYLEESSITMIAPVASAPNLTRIGDHIFRTSVSTTAHAKNLAVFAKEELGATSAAILYINEDNGVGYRDDFETAFTQMGGYLVATESYAQDSRDVRTQIVKIQEENPDVIFIAGQLNLETILRQLREANVRAEILGISAMESAEMIAAAGEAAEGVFYSYAELDDTNPETRAYLDRYYERFGERSDWYAANAYDATMLIARALEHCEDSSCIKDNLHSVRGYPGAAGITSFDEYGEVEKPLTIKTVKNGGFVVYGG